VEGNPGFCAPVLGGAKLAADNLAVVIV
jgi:hypothetical protein